MSNNVGYIPDFESVTVYGSRQASIGELSGSLSRVEVLRGNHNKIEPLRVCELELK